MELNKDQKNLLEFIRDNKITCGAWLPSNSRPDHVTHFQIGNDKKTIKISVEDYSLIRKFIRVPFDIGETMFLLNEDGRKVLRDDKR